MYTFSCTDCGDELEIITSFEDRDRSRLHSEEIEGSECGGALVRHGVEKINLGEASYQPGAVLSDGSVVKGHFGKTARKKGGWYRP
jgi:hypothetical protein